MCGIAGIISLNKKPIMHVEERSKKMMKMLDHRGPDYHGYWVDSEKTKSIINTRLAIVDVENKFDVPFVSNSNKSIITYNGEIYNYQYLGNYLKSKGVALRFRSDTEILTEGLEYEGLSFLKKIDGFWSFGIYNKQQNEFILSRDLMGEKGLYYLLNDEELIFCSEVEPIIAVSKNICEIDYQSLLSGFAFRAAPPQASIIKNIKKLSPGHSMVCKLDNGDIKNIVTQSFELENWLDFFNSNPSEEKVLDTYEEYLYNAIKSRVPDEVNFHATLSGGLDSAVISIYASKYFKGRINTVYMHSSEEAPLKEGDYLDEYEASIFSSKTLNTNHNSFSLLNELGIKNYKKVAENCFDGVFCEGAPSFASIAEFIKQKNSKVLLLSDGPDDFLGGYNIDKDLYEDISNNNYIISNKKPISKREENLSLYSSQPFYFRPIHGGTDKNVLDSIFSNDILKTFKSIYGSTGNVSSALDNELDVSQKIALSYASYSLPDHFNTRIDRSTMMHSIEARVPLQAPSLVNLMIGTPGRWRYKNDHTKYIFRKIVERHLGKDIAYRKKYGFAYPIWKNKTLNKELNMGNYIMDSDFFESPCFNKDVKKFFSDELKTDNKRHIWMAYCASKTYERYKELIKNNHFAK